MLIDAGRLVCRALMILDDWKDPLTVARELQITIEDAKALLNLMFRKGLIIRDGFLYRRW